MINIGTSVYIKPFDKWFIGHVDEIKDGEATCSYFDGITKLKFGFIIEGCEEDSQVGGICLGAA